ncbi:MAG TPA: DUF2069 domain-containing protein [Burkholderiaceae bacterium]|nr:DUF2069 domain-containing protein [Burkholderiaceae bacterium]
MNRDPLFQRYWYWAACVSLVALLLFMTAREAFIAPLRPQGSALVLKGLPLACALVGIFKRRLYTYQWAALLVLVYIAFSLVGALTDPTHAGRLASGIETALGLAFFVSAVSYVRPYKRAARASKKQRSSIND